MRYLFINASGLCNSNVRKPTWPELRRVCVDFFLFSLQILFGRLFENRFCIYRENKPKGEKYEITEEAGEEEAEEEEIKKENKK